MPVFFPIQKGGKFTHEFGEFYSLEQIVGAGFWFLEHMQAIDPEIDYVRLLHTDGHIWKLYELHRTHLKKTGFFAP